MKMMLSSGINGFPMEITARDESGSVVYSQRVTSLQKTTVDPSEFNYSQFPKGEDVLKEQVANGVKK